MSKLRKGRGPCRGLVRVNGDTGQSLRQKTVNLDVGGWEPFFAIANC
jgi:hypothetical protein